MKAYDVAFEVQENVATRYQMPGWSRKLNGKTEKSSGTCGLYIDKEVP